MESDLSKRLLIGLVFAYIILTLILMIGSFI